MKTKYIGLLLMMLFVFASCDSEDDTLADPLVDDVNNNPDPMEFSSGTADFSRFVAVGNSLTAGYSDGALFIEGQENSLPNILAGQFALAGGGPFTQPLMNDNIGGLLFNGNVIAGPRRIFDLSTQSPVVLSATPTTEITNIMPGPYNNMGVPGAKSFHLLAPGYGNIMNFPAAANPYFIRMASSPDATVLGDALAMNPTFFSLWIGNNDVLGYATTGGDGTDPITPQATFDGAMAAIVMALTSATPDGMMANIPNVTDAPFFTTVPFAPLSPANPNFGPQIPVLNAAYAQLNAAFAFLGMPDRQVTFSTDSASAVVIHDESLANITVQLAQVLIGGGLDPLTAGLLAAQYGQSRQANANDLLLLTSSGIIGELNQEYFNTLTGLGVPPETAGQLAINGVTYPLQDKWVLIPTEQQDISNATQMFNQTISNLATQYNLPLFDANAFLTMVANGGVPAGSTTITANYVTGGAFSLDGVHPSPRGYAVAANQMIDLINAQYGSDIPKVNPVDYTGLYID